MTCSFLVFFLFCVVVFYVVLFVSVKAMSAPNTPLMLHNHDSVYWEDVQGIMVLGGGGNCFSFGTHFNEGPIMIKLLQN